MMLSPLVQTPLFGITLTLVTYELASCVYRRWPLALLNPVIVTAACIILFLSLLDIPYAQYAAGGDILLFLLGPAVVALGLPLYQRRAEIISRLLPTLCAVSAGAVASIVSATGILLLFGSDTGLILSMAPKSVTTPIAIGISEKIGGIVPLTAAIVVVTGCFGGMVGPTFCRLLGIRDPFAMGLAMGTAAHGLGTGRMLEIDRFGGAMAGLSIGLNGVITAAIIPIFVALLP
ncbi:MAG: LrgB family protein [Geobacteraceae bacterium]|nr:LrgB family protein [Geobacteraceae bacterium]